MYNFDDTNYTAGESRTIYFDNVSQLLGNASGASSVVNPTQQDEENGMRVGRPAQIQLLGLALWMAPNPCITM
jgi:hypothetical protein